MGHVDFMAEGSHRKKKNGRKQNDEEAADANSLQLQKRNMDHREANEQHLDMDTVTASSSKKKKRHKKIYGELVDISFEQQNTTLAEKSGDEEDLNAAIANNSKKKKKSRKKDNESDDCFKQEIQNKNSGGREGNKMQMKDNHNLVEKSSKKEENLEENDNELADDIQLEMQNKDLNGKSLQPSSENSGNLKRQRYTNDMCSGTSEPGFSFPKRQRVNDMEEPGQWEFTSSPTNQHRSLQGHRYVSNQDNSHARRDWCSLKRQENARVGSDYYEKVESSGKRRKFTVSIAIPVSILKDTIKSNELRTYMVGQLARAASIYSVDEIVVYQDGHENIFSHYDSHLEMMRVILEYQECPQYLRKQLFPFSEYLRSAAFLNVLNSPHHLKRNQWCQYREGVVCQKASKHGSYIDVGLGSPVYVDQTLKQGTRVTVKFPDMAIELKKPYGTVVERTEPRKKGGFYWGYVVRVAKSFSEVFSESSFKGSYDLVIGTSDKGDDAAPLAFGKFRHAIIVFGGQEGLEAVLSNDDQLKTKTPSEVFNYYLNTCPSQQCQTIRTEEAVLISLCVLQPKLYNATMQT